MLKLRDQKRIIYAGLSLSLAAFSVLPIACANNEVAITSESNNVEIPVTITRVVDGDTFHAQTKNALTSESTSRRVQGIDTPEPFDARNNFAPTTGLQKLYANAASDYAKNWLANKNVTLVFNGKDNYTRDIVRVKADGEDFGIAMVKAGKARVYYISLTPGQYYSPDTSYVMALYRAQWEAYQAKLGIWENYDNYHQIYPF